MFFCRSSFVGREKALMRGEAAQVEAVHERPLLEFLKRGIGFVRHLAMEDLDAVEAHVGREVDALVEVAIVFVLELPEGIGRDGDAMAIAFGQGRIVCFRGCCDQWRRGNGSQKLTSCRHGLLPIRSD